MKALLLAAGLGSRLRPLTLYRPKPLCLFYGQALLDIVYRQVSRAGVNSIAINTHHLGERIAEHVLVKRDVYVNKPHISHETEILGTGGCINPLRQWIGSDQLLIFNADIIADVDLTALLAQHEQSGAVATMVLLPKVKAGATPIYWDGRRQIEAIGGASGSQKATFAGIHIISQQFMDAIPHTGFQHIIDSYQRLLKEGASIEAFIHNGFWADLGTPSDYMEAHRELLRSNRREEIASGLGLESKIRWLDREQSACLDQPFSGPLEDSFLFGPIQSTTIRSIQSCIVYPSSHLEGKSQINRLIITPEAELSI